MLLLSRFSVVTACVCYSPTVPVIVCICLSSVIIFPTICGFYKTESECVFVFKLLFRITSLNCVLLILCALVVNLFQLWLLNKRFDL